MSADEWLDDRDRRLQLDIEEQACAIADKALRRIVTQDWEHAPASTKAVIKIAQQALRRMAQLRKDVIA